MPPPHTYTPFPTTSPPSPTLLHHHPATTQPTTTPPLPNQPPTPPPPHHHPPINAKMILVKFGQPLLLLTENCTQLRLKTRGMIWKKLKAPPSHRRWYKYMSEPSANSPSGGSQPNTTACAPSVRELSLVSSVSTSYKRGNVTK